MYFPKTGQNESRINYGAKWLFQQAIIRMIRRSQLQISPIPVEKEVQIILNEILDKVTKEHSINAKTLEKRIGAVKRKSCDNSFKTRVINTYK